MPPSAGSEVICIKQMCPDGWTQILNQETNEYYDLCWKTFKAGSFFTAIETCEANDATLPLPRNEREKIDFISSWEYMHVGAFLGMKWDADTEKWIDLDGKEVTYFSWDQVGEGEDPQPRYMEHGHTAVSHSGQGNGLFFPAVSC